MNKILKMTVGAIAALGLAGGANASLSLFQSFSGNGVGVSTAGCGAAQQRCTMTANVPLGATVLGVYLYSSLFGQPGSGAPGGGYNVAGGGVGTYNTATALGVNPQGGLQAYRQVLPNADVVPSSTGITVTVTETNSSQDGEAMVVVYSTGAADPVNTVFIFDGFSASTGDGFAFSIPTVTATSSAEMRLGIGFSFDGSDPNNPTSTNQVSRIGVNGPLGNLTNFAGHCDDAQDASCTNGNLITVGGDNDPFSPSNPTVGQDHERYNLLPLLALGTTSVAVSTLNASNDDNIFLAVFKFSGVATVVNATPEPTSLLLLGASLLGLGFGRRKSLKV